MILELGSTTATSTVAHVFYDPSLYIPGLDKEPRHLSRVPPSWIR